MFGFLGASYGKLMTAVGAGTTPDLSLSNNSIAEAAANLASVGTASIVTAHTGTPVWAISDPSGTFTINSSTGAVTVLSNTALTTNASLPITISVSGVTPTMASLAVTIWVVATAAVIDLIASSDTGASSTDNITNVNTPTFDVTATLYTGDIVKLYDNSVLVFSHTLSSAEAAARSFTDTTVFADGSHPLTLTVSRGGFENTPSASLTVTVDTTAPVLSSPTGTKTGSTTASLSVATDTTSGTLWWVVVLSTDTAPTIAEIKAGHKSGGAAAPATNGPGGTTVSASPFTASVTGLTGSTTYLAYFVQDDVAGNTSLRSVSASSFTTDAAASYTAQGVTFSSTAYATKTTALTGVSNGKSGLVSFWLKNPNAISTQHTILNVGNSTGATGSLVIAVSSSTGKVFCVGKDSTNTTRLSFQTVNAYNSMAGWKHFLYSWNTSTAREQIYVNNATDESTITNDSTQNITYSGPDNSICGSSAGTTTLSADIADLQAWFNVDIDLSITANRRAFIDAGGNPVDPTTAPTTLSLATQHILLSGASSTWVTNDGSGGGFTLQAGTTTNSATNPP